MAFRAARPHHSTYRIEFRIEFRMHSVLNSVLNSVECYLGAASHGLPRGDDVLAEERDGAHLVLERHRLEQPRTFCK